MFYAIASRLFWSPYRFQHSRSCGERFFRIGVIKITFYFNRRTFRRFYEAVSVDFLPWWANCLLWNGLSSKTALGGDRIWGLRQIILSIVQNGSWFVNTNSYPILLPSHTDEDKDVRNLICHSNKILCCQMLVNGDHRFLKKLFWLPQFCIQSVSVCITHWRGLKVRNTACQNYTLKGVLKLANVLLFYCTVIADNQILICQWILIGYWRV